MKSEAPKGQEDRRVRARRRVLGIGAGAVLVAAGALGVHQIQQKDGPRTIPGILSTSTPADVPLPTTISDEFASKSPEEIRGIVGEHIQDRDLKERSYTAQEITGKGKVVVVKVEAIPQEREKAENHIARGVAMYEAAFKDTPQALTSDPDRNIITIDGAEFDVTNDLQRYALSSLIDDRLAKKFKVGPQNRPSLSPSDENAIKELTQKEIDFKLDQGTRSLIPATSFVALSRLHTLLTSKKIPFPQVHAAMPEKNGDRFAPQFKAKEQELVLPDPTAVNVMKGITQYLYDASKNPSGNFFLDRFSPSVLRSLINGMPSRSRRELSDDELKQEYIRYVSAFLTDGDKLRDEIVGEKQKNPESALNPTLPVVEYKFAHQAFGEEFHQLGEPVRRVQDPKDIKAGEQYRVIEIVDERQGPGVLMRPSATTNVLTSYPYVSHNDRVAALGDYGYDTDRINVTHLFMQVARLDGRQGTGYVPAQYLEHITK